MTSHVPHRLALAWAFAQAWVGKGASTLVYVALGYLLPPQEFGAYAVAATFLVLAEMFVEQSIAQTAIQLHDGHTQTIQDLHGVAFLLGGACACGSLLMAFATYFLYPTSTIPAYSAALAVCPALIGLNAVPLGLLRKAMDYKILTLRSAWATIFAGALGIITASITSNGWALVVMSITYQLVSWVLLRKYRPKVALPIQLQDSRQIKHLLLLNSHPKIADFIETKGLELLAANILGLHIAGALTYANKIAQTAFTFLISPTIDTAWGQFARLRANAEPAFHSYKSMSAMLTMLGLPAFCILSAASYDFLPHLLGGKWLLLRDLLPLFCLGLLIRGPLYLSTVMAQVIRPNKFLSTLALIRSALTLGLGGLLMTFYGHNATAVIGFCLAGFLVIPATMQTMISLDKRVATDLRNQTVFLTLSFAVVSLLQMWVNHVVNPANTTYLIFTLGVSAVAAMTLSCLRHLDMLRKIIS